MVFFFGVLTNPDGDESDHEWQVVLLCDPHDLDVVVIEVGHEADAADDEEDAGEGPDPQVEGDGRAATLDHAPDQEDNAGDLKLKIVDSQLLYCINKFYYFHCGYPGQGCYSLLEQNNEKKSASLNNFFEP